MVFTGLFYSTMVILTHMSLIAWNKARKPFQYQIYIYIYTYTCVCIYIYVAIMDCNRIYVDSSSD